MMVVSIVAGRVITKTGRYKIFPIIGGVGMIAGMLLLTMLDVAHEQDRSSRCYMVVLGVGMGFLMQTTMLIAQNSVEQKDLGVGQQRGDVLPVDRRLVRRRAVRRDLRRTGWPTSPRLGPGRGGGDSAAAGRSTRRCCSSCRRRSGTRC